MHRSSWLWVFIWAVTALDLGCAWHWRRDLRTIEMNPVANWIYAYAGVFGILAWRFLWTVYAHGMSMARTPLAQWVNLAWFVGNVLLLVVYTLLAFILYV
jgi:hypothetical protein